MMWGYTGIHDQISVIYQPPLRAVERVDANEWCRVVDGYVLVIWSPVLVVDGFLRLDGVVRVG